MQIRIPFYGLLPLLLICVPAVELLADENWPELRGPHANGHASAKNLPVEWSETKNVRWKTAIHDRGWSSPVVWGDQIWMTTAAMDGHKFYAICVDRNSGKVIHDEQLFTVENPKAVYSTNSYASGTPTIEEGRVYVHYGSFGTACLDTATAKVIWLRQDLPCFHFRGPGSSPILYKNMLIVHFDGYDHQYIVALDKATGKTIWKKDRKIDHGTTNGDMMKAFCTPILIDVAGQKQLISPAAHAAVSLVPETGEELWRVRYKEHSTTVRPLYEHGLLFISTGFGKAELLAVKANGLGDVTSSHIAWRMKKSIPSKPSMLIIDDLLYMVHDSGVASCVVAKTGKPVWQKRIGGKHSASPVYVDGRIYFFDHSGKTTVMTPGRDAKILTVNQLGTGFNDGFRASAAIVNNAFYLRNATHLYRIEK